MVGDVLGQRYEGHGGEQQEQAQHVSPAGDGVGSVLVHAEHAQEGEPGELEQLHVVEGGQVNQLQGFAAGGVADQGHHQRDDVSAQNTDDEGDHLHALGALHRGKHGDEEGHQTHQNGDQIVIVAADGGVAQVVHGAAAQAQTDQGHGGADDHGGQQLVDPCGAGLLNDESDQHIHQTGEHGAQKDAAEAIRHGANQRADEGEGAAQKHGALAAGSHQNVEQGAHSGAEQRGGLVQVQAGGVGQDRHQQGGGHDGQQLLEGIHKVLFQGRPLVDVVHEFHRFVLLQSERSTLRAFGRK